MMVVGIPNVGSSSFINRLSGRAAAKTGDRPGITQTKQWIRIAGQYELLDTPGILWPKFENEDVGRNIAFTGGIKDEILDIEDLAYELLGYLKEAYFPQLCEKYGLSDCEELTKYELLEAIGRKRGCMVSGGEIDTFRAANIIMSDFRAAKIGRITLESPSCSSKGKHHEPYVRIRNRAFPKRRIMHTRRHRRGGQRSSCGACMRRSRYFACGTCYRRSERLQKDFRKEKRKAL